MGKQNPRIMELEGTSKAIQSNPLLKAGIQIKADPAGGCPVSSLMAPALERWLPPEAMGSIVILL